MKNSRMCNNRNKKRSNQLTYRLSIKAYSCLHVPIESKNYHQMVEAKKSIHKTLQSRNSSFILFKSTLDAKHFKCFRWNLNRSTFLVGNIKTLKLNYRYHMIDLMVDVSLYLYSNIYQKASYRNISFTSRNVFGRHSHDSDICYLISIIKT